MHNSRTYRLFTHRLSVGFGIGKRSTSFSTFTFFLWCRQDQGIGDEDGLQVSVFFLYLPVDSQSILGEFDKRPPSQAHVVGRRGNGTGRKARRCGKSRDSCVVVVFLAVREYGWTNRAKLVVASSLQMIKSKSLIRFLSLSLSLARMICSLGCCGTALHACMHHYPHHTTPYVLGLALFLLLLVL